MKYLTSVILPVLITCACQKPVGVNNFADDVLIKISDYQDKRLSDSLYQYFMDEEVLHRRHAVLAFASVQDSMAVDSIGQLLTRDSAPEVRKAAAFALGQTRCLQSELLLLDASKMEKDTGVLQEIFESYGKVTRRWKLEMSPYDSLVQTGLAWSIYRSGLKGIGDSILNMEASTLLSPASAERTRLAAAHFFARGAKDFEKFQQIIMTSAGHDSADNVRMASTVALGKIISDSSRIAAQNILQHDRDYRVRINAIRALQSFPLKHTLQFLINALQDENVNVGIAAAEAIKALATKEFWNELVLLARAAKNWRIQANLYEASLAAHDHKELTEEIIAVYEKVSNPYHKAALLIALQHSIMSYAFVQKQLLDTEIPVIKSAAATSLVAMNYRKNFDASLKKHFASAYVEAMNNSDPAVVGIIAGALADSALGYRNEIKEFSFLYDARKKLSLPKDIEAIQPLEAVIAYFEGRKFPSPVKNEFNHSIDWRLVKTIPREQKAMMTTSKGEITIRLFVEEAPGSVSNFVALVNQGYFDNKVFHRVAPNFVVQAGCNRGDGWGSEDYSIRSEFSERRYKTGSIGMASAGKDTEGTQWFITHSPTPHLDGRYTIFAEVERGMEVVHHIEIGDKILKIELIR